MICVRDNNKAMVISGEEGRKCEVLVRRMRLEYVSEFKYLGCVLDKSCENEEGGK